MKGICLIILSFLLVCTSCKKTNPNNNPLLEQYFETNILNRNIIVTLAKDNTTDLTADYNGYVFVLLKTDLYHGPLKATNDTSIYEGSWSCNSDYSKITIILPDPPSEFSFLSREWRFTSKNLPTLKLAPWGSSDPTQLNMQIQ
jgi:hypothetical protein